jgi:putative tryptophan/tyrosine transport system substrate-binding protein
MTSVMDRRRFLLTSLAGILGGRFVAEAQQARPERSTKVVGVLQPGAADVTFVAVASLRRGLRELGYIEGQSIRLEYRWAEGKVDTLPRLAAELVRLNVDVLYATGPQAMRAAVQASRTIPIVGDDLENDPVEAGFASSIGKPGGNVTGLFLDLPELTGKWLQLVREVAPATRRAAVLWDATSSPHQLHALRRAAQAAMVELHVLEVRRPAEYADALQAAVKERQQALIQLSSPLIRQASRLVADFAINHRLPAISMFRTFAEAGGLMAYGPDLPAFFGRSARYVDRVLKGAKPGDLPIELPTKFELVINLKTAKALGLTIPPSLLTRADQVIE